MIAIVALILIISMMYLLLTNKVSPIVAFVILPIIATFILILSGAFNKVGKEIIPISQQISTMISWSTNGIDSTMKNATLFIFSIIYFGIMSDAGMFDPLVTFLVKISGKNPVMIYLATALIALVSQLDGATATTYLITIPAMLPIFKKLKLNILAMLTIIGVVTGSWNMIPWGGTIIRTATTVTNLGVPVTPQELWKLILPIEILGMFLGLLLAIIFGYQDKKRLIGLYGNSYFENIVTEKLKQTSDEPSLLKRPKLLIINLILTASIISFMILNSKIPSYFVFLVATAIALVINYKGLKLQNERILAHASTALGTASTFLAAGIFLGIFKETGMTTALATIVLDFLPNSFLPQIGRIFGLLGSLIGMAFSPDLYYYSLLPVVGEVTTNLGGDPLKVGLAMLVGQNIGTVISPCIPTTFLAVGLAGVELKDHIKFSLKYLLVISIIMIISGIIIGIM
ncbi:MAG: citrate:proton symporter [Fusobacteriaceae bacterium]